MHTTLGELVFQYVMMMQMSVSSEYYIQYFLSIDQMQGKECNSDLLQRAMLLAYRYMDYWIPVCVFISFPIWILPGLLYYITWKLIQACKCTLALGRALKNSKHTHHDLSYAILRGNGRYLREEGEDVHKKQFYDYTSRRFMSICEFEPETKIIELQCESEVGLEYFASTITEGTVVGVHSNKEAFKLMSKLYGMIDETDYELTGSPAGYDCLLLFNFKDKSRESGADLLKILAYCRYHMNPSGYLVFGDYFEAGELNTYIDLFQAFRMKVVDQEDITKNIEDAKKLEKYHQRCEQQLIQKVSRSFHGKLSEVEIKFIVLIVEKEL